MKYFTIMWKTLESQTRNFAVSMTFSAHVCAIALCHCYLLLWFGAHGLRRPWVRLIWLIVLPMPGWTTCQKSYPIVSGKGKGGGLGRHYTYDMTHLPVSPHPHPWLNHKNEKLAHPKHEQWAHSRCSNNPEITHSLSFGAFFQRTWDIKSN